MKLEKFLEDDVSTLKVVKDLINTKSEKIAIEKIEKMKKDKSVRVEKVKVVLMCEKRSPELNSAMMAIYIAIIAIFFSLLNIDIPFVSDPIINLVFLFLLVIVLLKVFFPYVDGVNNTEQRNHKIDYLVWLIEKNSNP